LWDQFHEGQKVVIATEKGLVRGAMMVPSSHLRPLLTASSLCLFPGRAATHIHRSRCSTSATSSPWSS
jgi:hypothetical protein